jgi:glutamyl-Q tRNA(Asp) synthetase
MKDAPPARLVSRFAPSPTGLLHLGHVHSALRAFEAARAGGGRFLLRIEDIDASRCRPEFEAAIFEDLAWLGLAWEEPVLRQSRRMAEYAKALRRLEDIGALYPCFCSRREIDAEIARSASAPHGPEGALYPGTCRNLDGAERERRRAEGRPFALRLDVARAVRLAGPVRWRDRRQGEIAAAPEALGDVVLARKDAPASYHLAVTVDDAAQGVSLIVRGEDLFHATHVHRLLQALLGLPTPAYEHHPLLRNAAGERLSKRDGALSLRALREAGRSADEVRRLAGL